MKKITTITIAIALFAAFSSALVVAKDSHWLWWQLYPAVQPGCPIYAPAPQVQPNDGYGLGVYEWDGCMYLLSDWSLNLIPEGVNFWEVFVEDGKELTEVMVQAPAAPELPALCWDLNDLENYDFADGRICEGEATTIALYYFSVDNEGNEKLNVRRWDRVTHEKLLTDDFLN